MSNIIKDNLTVYKHLKQFTHKQKIGENNRPVLEHIYIDDKYMVACDGHMLTLIEHEHRLLAPPGFMKLPSKIGKDMDIEYKRELGEGLTYPDFSEIVIPSLEMLEKNQGDFSFVVNSKLLVKACKYLDRDIKITSLNSGSDDKNSPIVIQGMIKDTWINVYSLIMPIEDDNIDWFVPEFGD